LTISSGKRCSASWKACLFPGGAALGAHPGGPGPRREKARCFPLAADGRRGRPRACFCRRRPCSQPLRHVQLIASLLRGEREPGLCQRRCCRKALQYGARAAPPLALPGRFCAGRRGSAGSNPGGGGLDCRSLPQGRGESCSG